MLAGTGVAHAGSIAYIGFGSNVGDRLGHLRGAIALLGRAPGVELLRLSTIYETAPQGIVDQPAFLNGVLELATTRDPRRLLAALLDVERELGRLRRERWGPRIVDLDLLRYDDLVIDEPGLTVPHPRLYERAFVVVPLAELVPSLVAPDGRPIAAVAPELAAEQAVQPYTPMVLPVH